MPAKICHRDRYRQIVEKVARNRKKETEVAAVLLNLARTGKERQIPELSHIGYLVDDGRTASNLHMRPGWLAANIRGPNAPGA